VEKFVVGDEVEWTSQAAGITRTKRGTVIEVVPAGQFPSRKPGRNDLACLSRDHDSYVVSVKGRGTYWPRASQLRKVAQPADSAA